MARLAPTLKEAELRVLLALDTLDPGPPDHSLRISSRKLAELSGVTRRNVQHALTSLTERCIITTRQGTATKAAAICLNFAKTVPMGPGVTATPPPGVTATPPPDQLALFRRHPGVFPTPGTGVFPTPVPTENKGLPGDAGSVDISNDSIRLIDRLLKASPKRTEPAKIETAKRWLHGYMAKFGQPDPHPPDDRICAQFLAVAEWPQLERLLYDLMAERKEPGFSYAWFVSVALQRIHGIQPQALKARRAELRLVRAGATTSPAPETSEPPSQDADPSFSENLIRAAAAGVKRP